MKRFVSLVLMVAVLVGCFGITGEAKSKTYNCRKWTKIYKYEQEYEVVDSKWVDTGYWDYDYDPYTDEETEYWVDDGYWEDVYGYVTYSTPTVRFKVTKIYKGNKQAKKHGFYNLKKKGYNVYVLKVKIQNLEKKNNAYNLVDAVPFHKWSTFTKNGKRINGTNGSWTNSNYLCERVKKKGYVTAYYGFRVKKSILKKTKYKLRFEPAYDQFDHPKNNLYYTIKLK